MKIVTSKKTLQKIEVTKEFNNCYVGFVLNEDGTRRMIEPPTNKNGGELIPQSAIIRKSQCIEG